MGKKRRTPTFLLTIFVGGIFIVRFWGFFKVLDSVSEDSSEEVIKNGTSVILGSDKVFRVRFWGIFRFFMLDLKDSSEGLWEKSGRIESFEEESGSIQV